MTTVATVDVDVDRVRTLFGRGSLCPTRGLAGVQIFGALFSDIASNQTLIPLGTSVAYRDRGCRFGGDLGSLAISSVVRGVVRSSAAPLPPLSYGEIVNAPANDRAAVLGGAIKLSIDAELDGGRRAFTIDAGQTIELVARSVSVELVAPHGSSSVPAQSGLPITPLAGVIFDAIAGTSLVRTEAPIGSPTATLSEMIVIPQNASATIAVPSFATAVEIMQTTAGAAATSWPAFFGNPTTGGLQVGSIPFLVGLRASVPGASFSGATHVQTDVDPAAPRFATLRWTIQP